MRIIPLSKGLSLPVPQGRPACAWLAAVKVNGKFYINKISCKVDDMETLHPGLKRRYIRVSRFVGFAGALAGTD